MHRKSLVIPLLLLASAAAARTAGGDGPAPDTETADTVIVVDKVQVTAIKQGMVLRSQPVAAAIGAGIDIAKPDGHMVVDICLLYTSDAADD